MQAQVVEHCEVGLDYWNTNAKLHGLVGDAQMVLFAFDPKCLASLRHLMAVVEVLDGLFEPNCDEQADCDGRNMDEKIRPCAHGVVWCMDVEHRYCVFLMVADAASGPALDSCAVGTAFAPPALSGNERVIVRNERYRGAIHWNMSELRKDPDSGKPQHVMRPKGESITRTDAEPSSRNAKLPLPAI